MSLPIFHHISLVEYAGRNGARKRHAMPVPRSLYLVVGAAAAPVGLCAGAMAPLASVPAGTIAVGLVLLLTAAGALLAADWRMEAESRQAWAEVAPARAEWNAGVRRQSAHIERRY